jgi:hypothetical protein
MWWGWWSPANGPPRPISPTVGGVLMQNVAFGAPFVAGGALKIVYDVALLMTFKKVKLKDEPDPSAAPVTPPPSA